MLENISCAEIGGVEIFAFPSISDLSKRIIDRYGNVSPFAAVAINPEKIVAALESSELRTALDLCEIKYADGIGAATLVSRRVRQNVARIPGCELWESLMKRAGELKVPVFLVGAKNEVILATVKKLETEYGTPVVGFQDGYYNREEEHLLFEKIRESGARLITVAMGSPAQELFISRCRRVNPDAFYMGVGGTYDVFTGRVKRAPKVWCRLNLEWLYRLLSQPSRIWRQTRLVKFMWWAYRGKI